MKKVSILLFVFIGMLIACQNPDSNSNLDPKKNSEKEPSSVAKAEPQPTPLTPPSERLPELKPEDLDVSQMGLYGRLGNLFKYDNTAISDEDSINIMNVAKYIYLIDIVDKPPMRTFSPKPGERIQEIRRNGEIVRVIYNQSSEDIDRRQRFYIRDGKVVYFVKREWKKTTTPPSATEEFSFYEDGKIVKALGRSGDLEVGAKPTSLSKFKVASLDNQSAAITAKMNARWLEVQDYLNGG
jgi:hypothetical protein